MEEASGRAKWRGCRLFPAHSSFHSAALVSISFLLHVMNVPEGRDEPLSEGEWDVGQEAAVGNGYVILRPSPQNPPLPPSLSGPRLLGAMAPALLQESPRSLLSSPRSSFQTPSPAQSDVESRSVPLVNGGCVS